MHPKREQRAVRRFGCWMICFSFSDLMNSFLTTYPSWHIEFYFPVRINSSLPNFCWYASLGLGSKGLRKWNCSSLCCSSLTLGFLFFTICAQIFYLWPNLLVLLSMVHYGRHLGVQIRLIIPFLVFVLCLLFAAYLHSAKREDEDLTFWITLVVVAVIGDYLLNKCA